MNKQKTIIVTLFIMGVIFAGIVLWLNPKKSTVGLPTDINPDLAVQNYVPESEKYKDPSEVAPEKDFSWKTYAAPEPREEDYGWWPTYTIEYPATWKKWGGEGTVNFREPGATTGGGVTFNNIQQNGRTAEEIYKNLDTEYKEDSSYIPGSVTIEDITVSGIKGRKYTGKFKDNPYYHNGDYFEDVFIFKQYETPTLIMISYVQDQTKESRADWWRHIASSFKLLE